MSLSNLLRKAFLPFALALMTAFVPAAHANDAANNGVKLTCYASPEEIAAVQNKITRNLGMIAATSNFLNVGTDKDPAWAMTTLMVNLDTKKGYQWARMPSGSVCIAKSYSSVELYVNAKLDPRAFLDPMKAPHADDKGNGKNYATVGANAALLVRESDKQFPMYRARVDDIITSDANLHDRVSSQRGRSVLPSSYIEYLVGNPRTGEGAVLSADFSGKMLPEYTGIVGTPAVDRVKFGARYSPAVAELLARQNLVHEE